MSVTASKTREYALAATSLYIRSGKYLFGFHLEDQADLLQQLFTSWKEVVLRWWKDPFLYRKKPAKDKNIKGREVLESLSSTEGRNSISTEITLTQAQWSKSYFLDQKSIYFYLILILLRKWSDFERSRYNWLKRIHARYYNLL